jgi:hypothetical protein
MTSKYVAGMHLLSEAETSMRLDALQSVLRSLYLDTATACVDVALELGNAEAVGVAHFIEKVAMHPDCLAELETKSSAQTRCAQKMYKIAIHCLRIANHMALADAMWKRAVSLRSPKQERHIGWESPLQTPTVWIDSLKSKPFWDCGLWPFVQSLEAAASSILHEVHSISKNFDIAYPYLSRGGTWQHMFLFRGHEWNTSLCNSMSSTCRLLLPELPTKPHVPYTTVFNEEIVIFRSEPGASVGSHCGSSNNVINIHLTLSGARGTSIIVGNEEIELQDQKAVCFQDSFQHAVEHKGSGEAERISLVVRVMHPDMSVASYGDALQTDVVNLTAWDAKASLDSEVRRLRRLHRQFTWGDFVLDDGDL